MQKSTDNYLEINKALWNAKVDHHINSIFYDTEGFLQGRNTLKDIELGLLGDVKGKTILHLQCHFGQDSLSLARMGAKVTGADISENAIEKARALNEQLGTDATFVCSDLYSLPDVLNEQFDIVFTTYGTISWLPDMKRWAEVVAHFLKPEGAFIMADFHPVLWMYDEKFRLVMYSYFNRETIIETEQGTYADRKAPLNLESVSWNHDTAEVLTALLEAKLQLTHFREFDYSPHNCFRNLTEFEPGKYHVVGMEGKLPIVFALRMTK